MRMFLYPRWHINVGHIYLANTSACEMNGWYPRYRVDKGHYLPMRHQPFILLQIIEASSTSCHGPVDMKAKWDLFVSQERLSKYKR